MTENSYVGTLPGHFTVDPSGGAGYSIPLKLPVGTAGMQPSLSLVYNSAAGNGLLGMGWDLHGLSSISRVPATMAQDGFIAPVGYSSNDRFSLDGQRLVPVSGTSYQDPNAIYHTEIESWQKIVPVYNQQRPQGRSGPDAFIVYTKDGKCLEYGTTTDSQIPASITNPSIREWALNKVRDLNGNYITIAYEQNLDTNALYPSAIEYTGNVNAGLAPQRSVQFAYQARPDTWIQYIGGYPVTTAKLLQSIQTFVDDQLVATYSLTYQIGQSTRRSQLLSITQSDAQGVALTPTTFVWQDGNQGIFDQAQMLPSTSAPWQGRLLPMDVNGDGRTDLVNAYSDGGYLRLTLFLSNGSGFSAGVVLPQTEIPYYDGAQLLPLDVNGDGCMDLVYAVRNGSYLGLTLLTAQPDGDGGWTYSVGPFNGAGPSDIPMSQITAMDVDGDGLVDLVCAYETSGLLGLKILFSNGTGFALSEQDRTVINVNYHSGASIVPFQFNGDAMSDLLYAYRNDSNFDVILFLSQGRRGFVQQASPVPSSATLSAQGILMALDVNGDGMDDLVHASLDNGNLVLQTLLSTGQALTTGVSQSFSLTNPATAIPLLLPIDLNGDGLPDLVVATQGDGQISLQALLSTGSGFEEQQDVMQPTGTIPWGATLLPTDLTGDAKGDLLYAFEQTIGLNPVLAVGYSAASGPYPDLLAGITNGLGGNISLTYKPLTDPTVYYKGSPSLGQIDAPGLINNIISGATFALGGGGASPGVAYATETVDFPKYVLDGCAKSDGHGNTYNFNYYYVGAKVDLTGRGWLGFEKMQETDWQYQTITFTTYNQTFPQTATIGSNLVTRSGDGAWMHLTTLNYAMPSPYSGVYQRLVQSVCAASYTFALPNKSSAPTPDETHSLTYTYDAYGNRILTEDNATSALYTSEAYFNNEDQWLLGFKIERTLSADAAGTQILSSEKQTYYSDTMKPETHKVWDDQQESWLVTQYQYDAYGNVTTIIDPSGATSTKNYDLMYHTFVAEETSPPNQAGTSLVSKYQYCPLFNVLLSCTDANEVTFQQQVDGLGRVIQQLGPDPSDSTAQLLTTHSWLTGTDGPYKETQRLLDWPDGTSTWTWSKHSTWSQDYVDGFQRAYKTIALGPDGATPIIVDTDFDSRGNILKQSLPYYDGTTPVFIEKSYDNYGRLLNLTQPVDGGGTATTTMDYISTNTLKRTEAVGTSQARQTILEYGRFHSKHVVVRRTDANNASTTFSYDPLGRMIEAVDPLQVTSSVTYDTLGRQISLVVRIGSGVLFAQTSAYDDVNRQVSHNHPGGVKTTLTYDAMRRLLIKTIAEQNTTFSYDMLEQSHGMGRLCNVVGPGDTAYAFEYDAYGSQTRISLAISGMTYDFQKSYSPTRKLLQLTYPDGGVLTNKYNNADRLQSVSLAECGQATTTFATFDDFTAFGPPGSASYGNNVQETLGFNDIGQLKTQVLSGPSGAFQDVELSWNAVNAVDTVVDRIAGNSEAFAFDPVGRLQQADGAYPDNDFAYDEAGNLTSKDGIDYAYKGYQVAQGTIKGEPVFSAQYDADGNMVSAVRSGLVHTMVYDNERQLIRADEVTFGYDYTGRRLTKQLADNPPTIYVAPYYEVVTLPDGGVQHTKYVPGSHGRMASVTTVDSGTGNSPTNPVSGVPATGTYYLHQDHLYNTTALTDATGGVTTTVNYLPYGEIAKINGPDIFRYKFSGKELDQETGFYYFGARYYDPVIGRFLTADSQLGGKLSIHDVFNRYAYALNDPVNYMDPTGHSAWWKWFLSFYADMGLVLGGIVVIVLTAGAAATIGGSTLLGAGISGFSYDITKLAEHKNFDAASWGEQLGIGAATGLVAGGVAAGASAFVGAMAESSANALARGTGDAIYDAVTNTTQTDKAALQTAFDRWAPRGLYRITTNTVAAIVGGTGSGALNDILGNVVNPQRHTTWHTGLGWAMLIGGVTGALGELGAEGVATHFSDKLTIDDLYRQADRDFVVDRTALLSQSGRRLLRDTRWNNFWTSVPGTVFSAADSAITSGNWEPIW